MLKYFVISNLWLAASLSGFGQMAPEWLKVQEPVALPRVFLLGEHERAYERMMGQYDKLLMQVYQEDMGKAYKIWSGFLMALEDQSKALGFELNGLKLWINVFFNPDGTIQHIVYFPKPNSKNMNFDQLTNFFLNFSKTYKLSDAVPFRCSHFGSAGFPTFLQK